MLLLISLLAVAQEPQTFPPFPVDVVQEGVTYQGILIDEETFGEYGKLKVLTREQEAKLAVYQDFGELYDAQFHLALRTLTEDHERGQKLLVEHY